MPKIDNKSIQKSHTNQHDLTDCGVAALLTLIKYYGGDNTIIHLRKISGTTIKGTTLLGLYHAAQKIGLKADGYSCTIESLIEYGQPVILHTATDNTEHYVVCFGFENNVFVISDPAKGICYYSPEQLKEIWKSGMCLGIEVTDKFRTKLDIKRQKREWILSILSNDKPVLIISMVLGLFISVLAMTMAVFSQKLIDVVLPEKDTSKLIIGIILVCILLGAKIGLDAIRVKLLLRQGKDFNNRIINFFYRKLLYMPISFFHNRKKGDMIARLNDTRRVQGAILSIAGGSAVDLISLIVCFTFILFYSPVVCLLSVIFSIVLFFAIYKYNNAVAEKQKEVMVGYATTESNFIATTEGISVIKSFGKEDLYYKMNQIMYSYFQDNIFNFGILKLRIGVVAGVLILMITVAILSVCSFQVISDQLSIGEFTAIIAITGSLFPSVTNLAQLIIPINEAKVAFNRIFEITTEPEDDHGERLIKDSKSIMFDTLLITDINFRFPGHKLLLSKLNMNCHRGKITCIIGECGCGKSTLFGIIQKFYAQESGSFLVDGIDVAKISLVGWRSSIAVVEQNSCIFNGTIISNIAMEDKVEKLKEAMQYCNMLGFDKFFNTLPQGYLTIVGEEGINLSGGQKQLITIARALLKNTPILLLDEPTSAMDSKTEEFVMKLLNEIKSEKIIVCISHKLAIVRKYSDYIYIIEDQTVNAEGSSKDLLTLDNFYSRYFKLLP